MPSASNKRTLYVGGLSEEVTEDVLKATFIPFGDITEIQIPLDYATECHRGFAFVEFELPEDARDAVDNMHEAELFGRTIRVNYAKPLRHQSGSKAVWSDGDWLKEHAGETLTEETQGDKEEHRIVSRIHPTETSESDLPTIFLDISIAGVSAGRIAIRLRSDLCPKTVENFRCLCTHENGYGYQGSVFHRIIPGFMVQGGDITKSDGTGGRSIYGDKFDDESFQLRHEPYCISMANSGANTNNSQFFITTSHTDWLNDKHVVFGKVTSGFDVIEKMEKCGTTSGKPSEAVVIRGCGMLL